MKATTEDHDPERRSSPAPHRTDEQATDSPGEARRAPAARPFSVGTAQRLQSAAGNRALSGMIAQRRAPATAAGPATAPPTPAGPATDTATAAPAGEQSADLVHGTDTARTNVLSSTGDAAPATPVQRFSRPPAASTPKFNTLKSDVAGKQKTLAAHPPPASKANAAQAAAKPPADDKQAQGKAANAEKMNAAQPGAFDKAAFIAAVNKAIADQAPKNLDEADNFGDSGKADAVKGQVQGKVGQGKEQSAKQIETTTKAAPDTAAAKEKPVTPPHPGTRTRQPRHPQPRQRDTRQGPRGRDGFLGRPGAGRPADDRRPSHRGTAGQVE
ncbi:hypothetical protein [Actinoplanes sp. NBRC 103695]|uniref:hypothetical protein n=1 Tax=Actinoplanes sp. NBRC 103695 TaxID=3032202 RepID=UPI0024A1DB75|nr:hypothetical protein [Actinoplanes sp. NBRC 103695]GLZ00744.1 hypothetical protein Acsp02_79960 [Actinoplanes sp. NBRC 103695]